jgi:hypothetical protein
MKAPAILCLLAAASPLFAAAPAPAPGPEAPARFQPVGDNYKKAAVLEESTFNPFKIQSATGVPGFGRKDTPAASNEMVAEAVAHRRITGVLLAANPADNRVIIGDEVFGVGDTVEFFDRDKGANVPLAAGASVTIHEIRQNSLLLDIGLDGESPRRLDFPLRDFWRP